MSSVDNLSSGGDGGRGSHENTAGNCFTRKQNVDNKSMRVL